LIFVLISELAVVIIFNIFDSSAVALSLNGKNSGAIDKPAPNTAI
jgi:hypothetical protein